MHDISKKLVQQANFQNGHTEICTVVELPNSNNAYCEIDCEHIMQCSLYNA